MSEHEQLMVARLDVFRSVVWIRVDIRDMEAVIDMGGRPSTTVEEAQEHVSYCKDKLEPLEKQLDDLDRQLDILEGKVTKK